VRRRGRGKGGGSEQGEGFRQCDTLGVILEGGAFTRHTCPFVCERSFVKQDRACEDRVREGRSVYVKPVRRSLAPGALAVFSLWRTLRAVLPVTTTLFCPAEKMHHEEPPLRLVVLLLDLAYGPTAWWRVAPGLSCSRIHHMQAGFSLARPSKL
jgi:hypothetical protein